MILNELDYFVSLLGISDILKEKKTTGDFSVVSQWDELTRSAFCITLQFTDFLIRI